MLASRAADLHDDGDPGTPTRVPADWHETVTQASRHAREWTWPVQGPSISEALEVGYAPRTPEGGPEYANVGRALVAPSPLPQSFAGAFHKVAAVALTPETYARLADAAVDMGLRWPAELEAGEWLAKPGPATRTLELWTATGPHLPIAKTLWSFDKMASGAAGEPKVVERSFDRRGIARLTLGAIYNFRSMDLHDGYSYALAYVTGAPGKEWEKPVVYCHVRSGWRQRQVLACVAGDGKWSGKPKAKARIDPPIIPGHDVHLTLTYGPESLIASIQVPIGNRLAANETLRTAASVEIASDLPGLEVNRVQLGHPAGAQFPDLPSSVVIRDLALKVSQR
jgi:hypothetical protein